MAYELHRAPRGHQAGGGVSRMPSTHSSTLGGGVTAGTMLSLSRIPSTHSSIGGGVTKMHGSSSIGSKTNTGGRLIGLLSPAHGGHGVVVV